MVESSVSRINRSLPSWEIQVNIEVTVRPSLPILKSWWFGYILSSNRPRSLKGKRQQIDLPEAQGPSHARESNPESRKFFCLFNLESWKFWWRNSGSRALESGIQGVESRMRECPLNGTTRPCSHRRCSAKLEFIDDFVLFIRAALLAMKTALGEIF